MPKRHYPILPRLRFGKRGRRIPGLRRMTPCLKCAPPSKFIPLSSLRFEVVE